MRKVLLGSHIRILELTKSLGIPIVSSPATTRMLTYLRFLPAFLSDDTMIIFGYRIHFFDTLLFRSLKCKNVQLLFDVADIPHLQTRFLEGSHQINKSLERKFDQLMNMTDIALFVSSSLKSLSNNERLKDKQTLIVPNASNPNFFRPTQLPKKKTILCVTGYAPNRGVNELVEAFHVVKQKHKDVHLRLIGLNMPSTYRSERISIENDKFYAQMPLVYSSSYLCVYAPQKNPYTDSGLPIKLFDTMAASRPIVVNNCYETQKLVEREKCGIATQSNAPILLAEAIDYLLSNPETAEEMGLKGREAIEKRHSWDCRARAIRQFLRKN